MIAEKIARGCEYHYKKRRRYIEAPYGIRTLVRKSDAFDEGVGTVCEVRDLGPGCKITRMHHPHGDPGGAAYFISLWGALHLTALIDFESEQLRDRHAEKGRDTTDVAVGDVDKTFLPTAIRAAGLAFESHKVNYRNTQPEGSTRMIQRGCSQTV